MPVFGIADISFGVIDAVVAADTVVQGREWCGGRKPPGR